MLGTHRAIARVPMPRRCASPLRRRRCRDRVLVHVREAAGARRSLQFVQCALRRAGATMRAMLMRLRVREGRRWGDRMRRAVLGSATHCRSMGRAVETCAAFIGSAIQENPIGSERGNSKRKAGGGQSVQLPMSRRAIALIAGIHRNGSESAPSSQRIDSVPRAGLGARADRHCTG